MAVRAAWKGYLKLSLVTCAVELFNATTQAEKVSFHVLNRKTGDRVRRVYLDAETGKEVDAEDQVKGYEVHKGEYVQVDTPYYLAPADEVSEEAFVVIRDALADKKMAGMARLVLYNRERPVVIEPREPGMLLTTLRFDKLVRKPNEVFEGIDKVKINAEMTDIATHIIDRKRMKFDPSRFEDKYEDALLELIKAKKAGRKLPKAEPAERPSNVISLFDALKKSLAEEGSSGKKGAKPSTRRKPAARSRPAAHRRSSAKSRHRKSA